MALPPAPYIPTLLDVLGPLEREAVMDEAVRDLAAAAAPVDSRGRSAVRHASGIPQTNGNRRGQLLAQVGAHHPVWVVAFVRSLAQRHTASALKTAALHPSIEYVVARARLAALSETRETVRLLAEAGPAPSDAVWFLGAVHADLVRLGAARVFPYPADLESAIEAALGDVPAGWASAPFE